MIYHGRIARAGVRRALVVIDMPFLSYQVSIEDVEERGRVMQASNAHAVKIEGGENVAPTVRALVEIGVPVMGHLGLRPNGPRARRLPGTGKGIGRR